MRYDSKILHNLSKNFMKFGKYKNLPIKAYRSIECLVCKSPMTSFIAKALPIDTTKPSLIPALYRKIIEL